LVIIHASSLDDVNTSVMLIYWFVVATLFGIVGQTCIVEDLVMEILSARL
jgi:hypothetical protein